MARLKPKSLWSVALWMCLIPAALFAQGVPPSLPPNGVMPGRFGVPEMVLDESSQWSDPIEVYSNSDVREFVPDITSAGWAQWHMEEFRASGTYTVPFYIYTVTTHETTNTILKVNTRQRTALLIQPLTGFRKEINLRSETNAVTKAISRITAIVQGQNTNFRGTTARDALREQQLAVAKMMDGASSFAHGEQSGEQLPVVSSPEGIRVPHVLKSVPAQYTPEALRASLRGLVTVSLVVNTAGQPTNIRVVKSLGLGLDEAAIKAVSQYRFTPAMEVQTGKLRCYFMTLSVNFRPQ